MRSVTCDHRHSSAKETKKLEQYIKRVGHSLVEQKLQYESRILSRTLNGADDFWRSVLNCEQVSISHSMLPMQIDAICKRIER